MLKNLVTASEGGLQQVVVSSTSCLSSVNCLGPRFQSSAVKEKYGGLPHLTSDLIVTLVMRYLALPYSKFLPVQLH